MSKVLGVVVWIVSVLAILVVVATVYFLLRYPRSSDPPQITVAATPERLARGEYLFHSVAQCAVCHSPRNAIGAFPYVDPATLGLGGAPFPLGEAGIVYGRNITPTALGSWTDGQLIRALREGVSAKRQALFPIMPYSNYRHLAEEDLYSLVVYLRTLPPGTDLVPLRQLHFPMSFIVRMMPSPAEWPPPATAPDASDQVAYGRYLTTVASCADCHTPHGERGEPLPGMDFAGGNEFPVEGWVARTANITPDSATGIGRWTREDFVGRFKSTEVYATAIKARGPDEPHTPMPWPYYATMTEQDLGAIYDYLRSLTPVEHRVVPFERTKEGAAR